MFHVNGKKILLAEFRDQKFIRENKNYFSNRLEGSNTGTTLLIRELRMEDSGIFTARFLVNGEEAEITYNVTVLGGGDIPLPVTGRVGETVSLTPRLNLTDPIIGVTWMVDRNGKKILLAEFRDQNFINHLEETTLQIRELRMEDSGIFTAQILFKRKIIDIYYNVTVLEPLPIPTPVIEKTFDGNSTDLCHLHCSVPSNSTTLSYSWTYRDTGTDRLYANGSTITVSLKDKALGAEFTCWVQNPAHRNSTSVPLYPCGEAQTKSQTKDEDFVFYIVISGTGRDYLLSLLPPMGWLCVILAFIITAVCIAVYKAVYKAVYSRRRRAMQDRRMLEYITNAGNSFPATSTDQVLETLSGNQLSRNLRITQFWLVITGKATD
eukprot:XP_017952411.1 PREDICTED: SLAM family member 6-like [Xenopus tropicalis]